MTEATILLAGAKPKAGLPAEIFAYAFDSEGKVRDFFSQSMTLDLAKVEPALRQTGLKMMRVFPGSVGVPPATNQVTLPAGRRRSQERQA